VLVIYKEQFELITHLQAEIGWKPIWSLLEY